MLIAVLGQGVLADQERAIFGDDLGLTRGDGCFDAMRLVVDADGSRVDHLDAHLARFQRSAQALEITADETWLADWRELIAEAVAAWSQPGEAVLRVMATRGRESVVGQPAGVLTIAAIDATSVSARSSGITVVTLTSGRPARAFADAPWLLGGVKTLSYAVNVAAAREAARRGAGDVLFTSVDGFALEAPRAALLWVRDDTLLTTALDDTGVLASVTQDAIFAGAREAGFETRFELLPTAELGAQPAWLVSAVRGVAPITSIDGLELPAARDWTARLNMWAGF